MKKIIDKTEILKKLEVDFNKYSKKKNEVKKEIEYLEKRIKDYEEELDENEILLIDIDDTIDAIRDAISEIELYDIEEEDLNIILNEIDRLIECIEK